MRKRRKLPPADPADPDVTQETMFLLGSEALKSMIDNEASRPLVFSGAYYQTKQNLLDIEKLNVNPDTIHVYRYVMKPDLPSIVTARKGHRVNSGSLARWNYRFWCGSRATRCVTTNQNLTCR